MKPTFKNERPVRRGESMRFARLPGSKSPIVDWNYQSATAHLHGGSLPSPTKAKAPSADRSFYGLSQAVFAAETKWEDRIEGIVLSAVIAIGACPIIYAIYIAARTV